MTGEAALRPMTAEEYTAWIERQTAAYAADLADAAGSTPEEARRRAEEQLAAFLPDGLDTAGTFLLRVLDEAGDPVGVLWLGPHPQRAGAGWVYEVEIDEEQRGRGLGRAAMLAAEQLAAETGWTALGLNVFGHNPRARSLYDSLGYRVASTTMTKPIS